VDPERQWIARLEPETPVPEELKETTARRLTRIVIHAAVAAAGLLGLLDYLLNKL
jgi:hypothetical protein